MKAVRKLKFFLAMFKWVLHLDTLSNLLEFRPEYYVPGSDERRRLDVLKIFFRVVEGKPYPDLRSNWPSNDPYATVGAVWAQIAHKTTQDGWEAKYVGFNPLAWAQHKSMVRDCCYHVTVAMAHRGIHKRYSSKGKSVTLVQMAMYPRALSELAKRWEEEMAELQEYLDTMREYAAKARERSAGFYRR